MSVALHVQKVIITQPYTIDKMGTSGLRKVQKVYNQPLFLEQFTQGIAAYFKEISNNRTLLLGGDPRKGNKERVWAIAEILVANGFRAVIAKDGLASTPAMSHGIRSLNVAGAIILTASHNPYTDVGIKINMSDGSPAPDDTVTRIHELQNSTKEFYRVDYGEAKAAGIVEEINIIEQYAELLDDIFNLNEMKKMIEERSLTGAFDSMHGAAGPFCREIFINRLDMNARMLREEPREDLGGTDAKGEPLHPEPDFDYIEELMELNKSGDYDIVAAWDSDVDRRLDGGGKFFVESADEFALFAKYNDLIKISQLFKETIYFCRSTVTAGSINKMEAFLKEAYAGKEVRVIETPTGFKWIAELGNWGVEESNGVGNPYIREKDGIFATLFLLKIMLFTGKNPRQLMEEIWKEFGRVYFTRGEVSGSDIAKKDELAAILENANNFAGKQFGALTLESAGAWNYKHPETGETAAKSAAWVLNFSEGNTVKARFSGTGATGYTLRVYCSKYDTVYDKPKSEITQPMKEAFDKFLEANNFSDRSKKYTDANQPDIYKK
ncbi:MAG: hypothetical protein GY754_29205 [bacterium]|nr:hypothetical protein [bacterium]